MGEPIELSSSKSLVNRYLVLKKGHHSLNLRWFSKAKDVVHLKAALGSAPFSTIYELGEGGTSLRFFATYLSTYQGEWILNCSESLLKRPQTELIAALNALGADLKQIDSTSLRLKSDGWKQTEIEIDMRDSTQVLTGLVLAALSRGLELKVKIRSEGLNSDYFEMTKNFVKQLNFKLSHNGKKIEVPALQNVTKTKEDLIESDWSSSAFLMVLASLKGEVCISNLSTASLQPDSVVMDLLKDLGASAETTKKGVFVAKGSLPYKAFEFNVQKSPDLFPVLTVLGCFCEGESKIFGAPQLKNKESNRIQKMNSLLQMCGYHTKVNEEGLVVEGQGLRVLKSEEICFDVSTDHRLYMATEILNTMGYNIKAQGADSILKSFAEYEDLKQGALSCFF